MIRSTETPRERLLRLTRLEIREAAPFPFGWLLSLVTFRALRRFRDRAWAYDQACGGQGFPNASRQVLREFGLNLQTCGRPRDLESGPLLVLANHPGLLDTPALVAAIDRRDLFVLAAPHRLWEAMPRLRDRFLLVSEDRRSRHATIREAVDRLRGGGAMLLYPSGRIDPDPSIDSDTVGSLEHWSQAPDFFARHVNHLGIAGASVSGVLSVDGLAHPWARLHRDSEKRRWLAATLQFVSASRQPAVTQVAFTPVYRGAGRGGSADPVRRVRRDLEAYWSSPAPSIRTPEA